MTCDLIEFDSELSSLSKDDSNMMNIKLISMLQKLSSKEDSKNVRVTSFSEIEKLNEHSNDIQFLLGTCLSNKDGEIINSKPASKGETAQIKNESSINKNLLESSSKAYVVDLTNIDLNSIIKSMRINKEKYCSFIDSNLDFYQQLKSKLTTLTAEEIENSKKLTKEIIENITSSLDMIHIEIEKYKTKFDSIEGNIDSSLTIFNKFEFISDIISE